MVTFVLEIFNQSKLSAVLYDEGLNFPCTVSYIFFREYLYAGVLSCRDWFFRYSFPMNLLYTYRGGIMQPPLDLLAFKKSSFTEFVTKIETIL